MAGLPKTDSACCSEAGQPAARFLVVERRTYSVYTCKKQRMEVEPGLLRCLDWLEDRMLEDGEGKGEIQMEVSDAV